MPLPACGFASELPLDDLKGQPACPGVTGGAGTFRRPVRPSVRRQLELFHRSPSFGLLFLATFGSGLGTWLAFVALTVDVYDRTHSGPWVSALLIAAFLPMIVSVRPVWPLLDL